MTAEGKSRSLGEILVTLEQENLLAPGWRENLETALDKRADVAPWFVRALVGFGAWFAAILLIGFVAGISVLATGGGYLVLGAVFLGAAIALRRRVGNDFARQLALAISIAGQGLFGFGVADAVGSSNAFEALLVVLAGVNLILLFVFPDQTHRFLSTVTIVVCGCLLLYRYEAQDVIALVGPMLAVLLIVLFEREAAFAARGWLRAMTAARAGLLIAAFGCSLLATAYVLPTGTGDFEFYPHRWLSTLLFGAMLLYVERRFVGVIFSGTPVAWRAMAFGLTAVVVIASLPAPGLIFSLFVIVLASVHNDVPIRAAGIAFVVIFTAAYFYGAEVGMLTKSASLVATGVVVLGCRWLFLRGIHGGVRTSAPDSAQEADADA